jgi:hypothetical protein
MSWKIRNLLIDRDKIRSSIYDVDLESDLVNIDFDNSDYNDLLTVEQKIKELHESGIIKDIEIKIINFVSIGYSYNKIGLELGMGRTVVRKIFHTVCDKVAFYLGDYFTDDGLIEYMIEKYKLSEEQIQKLIKTIKG